MDPAVYARAFGVQSEANKVTVTRVASNEIVYRRAVDAYRRDMASKMTSIKREQNKLKRNMRYYKRRLYNGQNLPIKKPKTFKVGFIACGSDTGFADLPRIKDQHCISESIKKTVYESNGAAKPIFNYTDSKHNISYKLQARVDTFLKSVDEHVHNMYVKNQDGGEVDTGNDIVVHDKRGRRRFLFGSSLIGSPANILKDLEFETENYIENSDFFSDSSSEGEGVDDEEIKRAVRNVSNRRRPKDLLRLNSAYFTSIDTNAADNDPLSYKPHSLNITNDDDSIYDNNNEVDVRQFSGRDQTKMQPSMSTNSVVNPSDILGKSLRGLYLHEIDPNQIKRGDQRTERLDRQSAITEQPVGHLQPKKKPSGVNFGDLIKFQHGANTKKLFSLVDQLASKYGVLPTVKQNICQGKGHDRFGVHTDIPKPDSSSRIKTSFFYAMKYGYGKDDDFLEEDKVEGSDTHTESYTAKVNTEPLPSVATPRHGEQGYFKIQIEQDTFGGSSRASGKERKTEFPHVNVDSSTTAMTYSRHSIFSSLYEKEVDKDQNSMLSQNVRPKKNSELINNRRSSMLDASNYVSNMRQKNRLQERVKQFEANYSHRAGNRRNSVNLQKDTISEHQRKADDSKIPWSSALGRIKLVHTLVDLTQFI